MCVWCAAIGKNQPALTLFEMGKRIEGMWAGAYTGLASLDQGRFRMEKIIGDCAVWEKSFSANEFPGNTAIFHSRTCSGGPASWGHPFISSNGLLVSAWAEDAKTALRG